MLPPRIQLPPEIEAVLEGHRKGLAEELNQKLLTLPKRCLYLNSRRVSQQPLRRTGFSRLLGRKLSQPTLSPTASKFGGLPYCESEENWEGWSFLGQLNLGEANQHLEEPLRGLLRLDYGEGMLSEAVRATWFPEPTGDKAVPQGEVASHPKWETQIEYRLGWSLPRSEADWFSLVPKALDQELWDFFNDWTPSGYNEDEDDKSHRLLGWPAGGLDEHYGFTPPPGHSENISEYEMLLRLTYDNEADFGWGTNWVYILVPKEGLAAGDLSGVVVTGANY